MPRPTRLLALGAATAARALAAQPAPAVTVAGVVRDAGTGAPVAGAQVQFAPDGAGDPPRDATGRAHAP